MENLKILVFSENKCFSFIKKLFEEGITDYFFLEDLPKDINKKLKPFLEKKKAPPTLKTKDAVGESLAFIEKELEKALEVKINSLLVYGESGTGKEVLANCLENLVGKKTPFQRINCASIPSELFESELFGHEKGSFTGAHAKKEGFLSQAEEGWVFLDEIACLPMSSQASLLRFLETGEIRKIGENRNTHLKIQVLAATNERLEKLVEEKKFRKDLLERLRNFEIEIPPLRERSLQERKEILNLSLEKIRKRSGKEDFELSKELELYLLSYPWKDGNIRELKNTLETLLIKSDFALASLRHLPKRFFHEKTTETEEIKNEAKEIPLLEPRKDLESLHHKWFLAHLEKFNQDLAGKKINKNKLARYLDISPWKISNYLKDTYDSKLLPSHYHHLVDQSKGLSSEVYFSEDKNSFKVGST